MYFPQIFSLNLYEILPVFRRLFGSEERKRLTLELYNAINRSCIPEGNVYQISH